MSELPLRSRGRVRLSVGSNKLELDRTGIRSINGIIFRSQCHIWAYASSIASDQASGAYIFRPSTSHARCVGKPKVVVSRGRLFTDVRLKYNLWAEQRFRFFEVRIFPSRHDQGSKSPRRISVLCLVFDFSLFLRLFALFSPICLSSPRFGLFFQKFRLFA